MYCFKSLLLVQFLIFLAVSSVCTVNNSPQTYDCKDVTSQSSCTGAEMGGVQCAWTNGACSYQTCPQFTSTTCVSVFLQGQQCFLGANGQCQGASSCLNFDSQTSCQSFKNQLCFWDNSTSTPSCTVSSCPQITDIYTCSQTIIKGQPCAWYGSISSCQFADCGFKSIQRCNGTQAGHNFCIQDGSMCRAMTCKDYIMTNSTTTISTSNSTSNSTTNSSNNTSTPLTTAQTCNAATAKISDTTSCMIQLTSGTSYSQTCGPISQCSDIKTQSNCQASLLTNITCIWFFSNTTNSTGGIGACKNKACKDFSTCPASVNGIPCFSVGSACTSCSAITDPCGCLSNASCAVVFNALTKAPTCASKDCTVNSGSVACGSANCFWNNVTLICGKSASDTGFTQVSGNINSTTIVINIYSPILAASMILLFMATF